MTEPREDGLVDISVQAEYAPIGVQIWPTLTPEQAHHFILRSVAVVRNEVRSWVVWTYEDNNIRTFELGEMVVARVTPQVAELIAPPQIALNLTPGQAEVVRDALRLALYGQAPGKLVDGPAVLKRLVAQI